MMTTRREIPRLTVLSLVLATAAGCGGAPEPAVDITWPPPPAEPMIKYQRSIYGSASLPRSFSARLRDFLFGAPEDQYLAKPYGIACAERDKLHVVDTARKGVTVLDLRSGRLRFFNSLGPHGALVEPISLVLDAEGRMYVADSGLGKIVIFDEEGQFLRFLGGDGELLGPVSLAFGPDEKRLYVVDTHLHAVKVFDLDGNLIGSIGQRGDAQGEFYHPLGIAISAEDIVYVVDSFHFAVQAFDLDGQFLFSFGSSPETIGSLARPRAIALDSDGHLYVTDALGNTVQIFDPRGREILDFGGYGWGEGQFRLPAGICVTSDDVIYVVDSINLRVQEFRYLPPSDKERES